MDATCIVEELGASLLGRILIGEIAESSARIINLSSTSLQAHMQEVIGLGLNPYDNNYPYMHDRRLGSSSFGLTRPEAQ